jgi:TonB family protein
MRKIDNVFPSKGISCHLCYRRCTIPRVPLVPRNHMKCMVHFELAVLLFCGVFLSAQTTPPSTEQKPESPANSSDQSAGNTIEVLTDTQGVDFGPYLKRVVDVVRRNWYELIPESARAPVNKKGKVVVEFAITKEGRVAGMQIIGPSGDIALDRAAYRGITSSSPFPPLPSEFSGQYVALRFHFYYNPDRSDLAASPTSHRSPSKSALPRQVINLRRSRASPSASSRTTVYCLWEPRRWLSLP